MLDFVRAKFLDARAQFRFVLAEGFGLRAIMLVDRFLDCDGAGHGGLGAERGRRGPQRETGHMPEREEDRRPCAPLDGEALEGGEMVELLTIHAAQDRGDRMAAKHRQLAFINALRAVFAGEIDAQEAIDNLILCQIAGEPLFGGFAGTHDLAPLKAKAARPSA